MNTNLNRQGHGMARLGTAGSIYTHSVTITALGGLYPSAYWAEAPSKSSSVTLDLGTICPRPCAVVVVVVVVVVIDWTSTVSKADPGFLERGGGSCFSQRQAPRIFQLTSQKKERKKEKERKKHPLPCVIFAGTGFSFCPGAQPPPPPRLDLGLVIPPLSFPVQ